MATEVRTPVFEGPLDLLLHLVLRSELDVNEISLSDLICEYLAALERVDLESSSEFLLIASTLIEIKSRLLLPNEEVEPDDDEADLWASRDRLLVRLLECQTYKNASAAFAAMMETAARSYPRAPGPEASLTEILPDPLEGVLPADIAEAYLRAVEAKPTPSVDLSFLSPITCEVPDAVRDLRATLPGRGRVGFAEITASLTSRIEVVTHFLAVLEMFKTGLLEIHQAEPFGRITVEWIPASDRSRRVLQVA